ncbi:MAG: M14 family zinc carboxypeptidase [Actinomycetota bacterium]
MVGSGGMPRLLLVVAATASIAAGTARADPLVDRRELLGTSVDGRPIRAFELGDPSAPVTVLVVGCIHGDECAGVAIAKRLTAHPPARYVDLWVVPDLNPDGRAAHTRGNARGVDLNRNFPYRWKPLPRGRYYSGRRPLSEPETRIATRLIDRITPDVTIWFHQPLALVDTSGGNVKIERRYARLVGLPLEAVGREPGSATRWQNHEYRGTTAFVVELPGGGLSAAGGGTFARAVFQLVAPSR